MIKRGIKISAAAAAASLSLLSATGASAKEYVVGGGFESPVVPAGQPYLLDATPFGWTGDGDLTVQGYAGSVPSGDGAQWFDLNPDISARTGIYQFVDLTAGVKYTFSFIYNGGGGGTTTAIAYAIGTVVSGSVSTASLSVYGGSAWQTFLTTFTPSATGPEKLSFLPNGVWSGGFIDAVSIQAPVPETSTWVMLLVGFASLGYAGYRKTKTRQTGPSAD